MHDLFTKTPRATANPSARKEKVKGIFLGDAKSVIDDLHYQSVALLFVDYMCLFLMHYLNHHVSVIVERVDFVGAVLSLF